MQQRSRPVLVALFAVLVEVVVLAGVANQWSSRQLTQHVIDRLQPASLAAHAVRATLTLPWRFAPSDGDTSTWGAQLAGIGTLLVLSYLLVLAAALGRPGWGQVLLTSWLGVVVAAFAGVIVRGLLAPAGAGTTSGAGTGRVSAALFGYPGGEVVLFGAALGLLVAVAAVIAVLAIRPPAAAQHAVTSTTTPAWYSQPPGSPPDEPPLYAPRPYEPPPDRPAETEPSQPTASGDRDSAEAEHAPR